jgi:3',5'-cyclic AMP phosphodiesterase CpdA
MKIEKVNGLYRKPRLTAGSRVPLLIWLPLILIICAVLVALSLRTVVLQNEPGPTLHVARKHSWKIAAIGDIACEPSNKNFNEGNGIVDACKQKDVGQALEREKLDAVVLLGDVQYPTGTFEDFERSFVPYFRDVKVPIYSVAGNHDYGNGLVTSGDLSGYKKAFDQYFPQVTYEEEGKTYYDFNLGPWKFYALDSNCEYVGGCDKDSEQYDWLTSKANATAPVCSVGFWHHPIFTSGIHKEESDTSRARDFWEVLDFAGTDIVLNGHDHHYERFAPKLVDGRVSDDGMRQFIVGTGGYSLRQVSEPIPAGQEKAIDDSFGYLYLELFPSRYEWQYKNVYGDVLDSGSANCSS